MNAIMSHKLYSADRRQFYGNGPLTLLQSPPHNSMAFRDSNGRLAAADAERHIRDLFPEGLSFHGWDYATRQNWTQTATGQFADISSSLEATFEFVRRYNFADMPSRLQSFFAFDDIDRVRSFAPGVRVVELRSSRIYKFDMNWLNITSQLAGLSHCAHQYWSGVPTSTPDWEYLLFPPVSVIDISLRGQEPPV